MLRLLFFLVLLAPECCAQQPLLRHYTVRDGLPSNVIYSIYQDRKGFVWFCTDQGISRFDGHHFQNYGINEGLPDNEVLNLAEDSFGRYWVACYNREPCYLKAGRVYTSHNDALCRQVEALGLEYTALFTDRDGVTCLAGSRIGGIYRNQVVRRHMEIPARTALDLYQSVGSYEYFALSPSSLLIRHGKAIRRIYFGSESIYVSFFKGNKLFLIDNSRNGHTLYQYTLLRDSMRLNAVAPFPAYGYTLQSGSDTEVICLTAKGIYLYSIPSNRLYPPQNLPRDLPANRMLKDREGHIWLGTLNEGVYLQGGKSSAAIYNTASGLQDENVLSLNSQPGGAVTAGFSGGFSLLQDARITTIPLSVLGKLNRILFAYELPGGDFLAGSDRGLYRIDRSGRQKRTVMKQAQKAGFRDGFFYYVAYSGGAIRYDSRTGTVLPLWKERTTAIAADATGAVWLGALHGLYRFDRGVVRRFNRSAVLSNSRITSMDRMADGRLVVATHRNGLFVWNGRTLHTVTKAQGLSSDHCSKVVADSGDRLWLCSDRGLDRLSLPPAGPAAVYHYSGADGLPADKINDVAISGTRLYAATSGGIVVLPKDAVQPPVSPPNIYILSVATHDTTIYHPDRPLQLSYPQNALQITYTGVSFGSGDELEYRYALEGGSKDTVVTKLSTLDLGAVKPGTYRLLFWARIHGGAWSPAPAAFAFVVQPPFWLTNWFITASGGAFMLFVYGLYRRKVRLVRRSVREKSDQQQRMAELELQSLRAQINPHFLFNALNSIQHFYSQNDERKANHYLSLFAQLIRRTLHHSRSQLLPLAEEIDLLTTYVELEQMRFKQAFSYTVEIGRGVNPQQVKVPAMLLQPYVENAIQHGLRPLTDRPGCLRIAFDWADGALLCRVDDNGIGLEQAQKARRNGHQSLGMEINRQRIETLNLMFKIQIGVTIIDKTATGGHGTCVSLTLPAYHEFSNYPHR